MLDPRYSSQQCSSCSHTEKENRISQAQFACTRCGHRKNADINAAKNVLAGGHAVLSLQPEAALAAGIHAGEDQEQALEPSAL